MNCDQCGYAMSYNRHTLSWVCDECDYAEFDESESFSDTECVRCGYEPQVGEWLIDGLCQFCDED